MLPNTHAFYLCIFCTASSHFFVQLKLPKTCDVDNKILKNVILYYTAKTIKL